MRKSVTAKTAKMQSYMMTITVADVNAGDWRKISPCGRNDRIALRVFPSMLESH